MNSINTSVGIISLKPKESSEHPERISKTTVKGLNRSFEESLSISKIETNQKVQIN